METHWIKDQVAIICGGASGIGRAIVLEAARKGAKTVIVDINEKAGRETVALVEQAGASGIFVPTDVTDTRSVAQMVERADAFGPIKYLANSAGLQTYGTLDTTTEKLWDETLDVNLKSMFLVSQQVLPKIRENGGGGIVNISSIQGLRCQKNVLAYATSKGAVIAMTRSMGLDHASEGIFVNCICPGAIDTPLLRFGAAQHGELQTVLKEWGAHHPIGRIGQPEEIAKLAMFLWSPDSNFIVGQAIAADGGLGSIIL